ncbi:MAG: PD40 domain-containing protein [Bacteroidetes bacterium]|nr:PD40 domain-containing protein [Bacteroidota bacterium]
MIPHMFRTVFTAAVLALVAIGCSDKTVTGPAPFQGTEMILVSVEDSVNDVFADRVQRLDPLGSGTYKTTYLLDSMRLYSSPRAGKMAFLIDKQLADIYKIIVTNMDGSNPVTVASASTLSKAISYPTLSPDAKYVVYATNDKLLMRVNIDGTNPQTLATDAAYEGIAAFSPDGGRVAYYGEDENLHIVNVDGSNRRQLAANVQNDLSGHSSVEFSPDGKNIVYVGRSTKGTVDIYVVNADGDPKPRQLTNDDGGDSDPTWSPDGTRIAWSAYPGDIWVMNADGTGAKDITTNLSNRDDSPSWGPDSQHLIFTDTYVNIQQGYAADVGTLREYDFTTNESRSIAFKVYRGFWGKF